MSPRTSHRQKIEQQTARLVETLRRVYRLPAPRPADKMDELAHEVVGLRALFPHDDVAGVPAWNSGSEAYRDAIRQAYRLAGVPSDSAGGFQANLRYHVGNVLREVAPAVELEALGMDVAGPRARAVRARKEGPRPRTGAAPVPALPSTDDPAVLAKAAKAALVAARRLAGTDGHGAELAAVLRDIIELSAGMLAKR